MKASELIAAMMDAGAPMEAALIALREIETRDDEIEQRRAMDRERKRRQRAATVTGQSRDIPETVTATPPLSRPPNENNLTPPPIPPINKPRAHEGREISIPDDWQPMPFGTGTESRSVVDGWPPGELKRQAEHFAAHHHKTGKRFKNWQAAWSTWVLNNRNFGNTANGLSRTPARESTRQIGERLAARLQH